MGLGLGLGLGWWVKVEHNPINVYQRCVIYHTHRSLTTKQVISHSLQVTYMFTRTYHI